MRFREFLVEYIDVNPQKLAARMMHDNSAPSFVDKFMREIADTPENAVISIDHQTYEEFAPHFATWLEQFDPTQKKKYVNWMITRYMKGDIQRLEDFTGRITASLDMFDRLSRRKQLKPEHKDINRIKYIESVMDEYRDKDGVSDDDLLSGSERAKSIEQKFYEDGEAELVYNDNDYKIVVPKSYKASCYFGKNTKWCTTGGEGVFFDSYSKQGPLYIILQKSTNSRWQFHFKTGQFTDETDRPIDMSEFIKAHPPVVKALLSRERDNNAVHVGDDVYHFAETFIDSEGNSVPEEVAEGIVLRNPEQVEVVDSRGGQRILFIKSALATQVLVDPVFSLSGSSEFYYITHPEFDAFFSFGTFGKYSWNGRITMEGGTDNTINPPKFFAEHADIGRILFMREKDKATRHMEIGGHDVYIFCGIFWNEKGQTVNIEDYFKDGDDAGIHSALEAMLEELELPGVDEVKTGEESGQKFVVLANYDDIQSFAHYMPNNAVNSSHRLSLEDALESLENLDQYTNWDVDYETYVDDIHHKAEAKIKAHVIAILDVEEIEYDEDEVDDMGLWKLVDEFENENEDIEEIKRYLMYSVDQGIRDGVSNEIHEYIDKMFKNIEFEFTVDILYDGGARDSWAYDTKITIIAPLDKFMSEVIGNESVRDDISMQGDWFGENTVSEVYVEQPYYGYSDFSDESMIDHMIHDFPVDLTYEDFGKKSTRPEENTGG